MIEVRSLNDPERSFSCDIELSGSVRTLHAWLDRQVGPGWELHLVAARPWRYRPRGRA